MLFFNPVTTDNTSCLAINFLWIVSTDSEISLDSYLSDEVVLLYSYTVMDSVKLNVWSNDQKPSPYILM